VSGTEAVVGADSLPPGDYAICELMGHQTLVGRMAEVERFGVKMLALEPLFNGYLLPVIFQGGPSIYRLTPCSAAVAWARQPKNAYQLPPSIAATLPPAALPPSQLPFDLDGREEINCDESWRERDLEDDEEF
jgi:hypothetical protein